MIPATATTLALFEQWREFLPNQRADAWLFPSETGITPVWYTNILDRSIRPSLETIGLGDVNFLVLRRSWVTEFSQVEKGSRESRADRRPQRRRAPERISAAGPGDTTPGYAQVGKEATVNSLAGRRDRRSRTITSEALDAGQCSLHHPAGSPYPSYK